jgi:biotin carboxyl carrier protein
MELKYSIGQTVHSVRVLAGLEHGATRLRLAIDDVEHDVDVLEAGAHGLDLLVDGRRVTLAVAPGEAAAAADQPPLWVGAGGWSRSVELVPSERRRGGAEGAGKPRKVTPTFPATVVAVMVAVGDEVRSGQPLVVVSAMKMEMTLSAPHAGVVRAVNAAPGATVSPGDELVVVEPIAAETRKGGGDER